MPDRSENELLRIHVAQLEKDVDVLRSAVDRLDRYICRTVDQFLEDAPKFLRVRTMYSSDGTVGLRLSEDGRSIDVTSHAPRPNASFGVSMLSADTRELVESSRGDSSL